LYYQFKQDIIKTEFKNIMSKYILRINILIFFDFSSEFLRIFVSLIIYKKISVHKTAI